MKSASTINARYDRLSAKFVANRDAYALRGDKWGVARAERCIASNERARQRALNALARQSIDDVVIVFAR